HTRTCILTTPNRFGLYHEKHTLMSRTKHFGTKLLKVEEQHAASSATWHRDRMCHLAHRRGDLDRCHHHDLAGTGHFIWPGGRGCDLPVDHVISRSIRPTRRPATLGPGDPPGA